VVALALRYAARQVPRQVLLDAWPGDLQLLERLLGRARRRAEPRVASGDRGDGTIPRLLARVSGPVQGDPL
jgi:hypothetical protein